MNKIEIESHLINNGFIKSKLLIGKDTEVFSEVFVKDDKESYIIYEGSITDANINDYQEKILWFQNWCSNDILKYNINLLFLYKASLEDMKELSKLIFIYERDSHVCRKIFLDLERKKSLDLLPFMKLRLEEIKVKSSDLRREIIEVLKTEEIYNELLEETFDIELLKRELLSK